MGACDHDVIRPQGAEVTALRLCFAVLLHFEVTLDASPLSSVAPRGI